jgi:hypothetical protein
VAQPTLGSGHGGDSDGQGDNPTAQPSEYMKIVIQALFKPDYRTVVEYLGKEIKENPTNQAPWLVLGDLVHNIKANNHNTAQDIFIRLPGDCGSGRCSPENTALFQQLHHLLLNQRFSDFLEKAEKDIGLKTSSEILALNMTKEELKYYDTKLGIAQIFYEKALAVKPDDKHALTSLAKNHLSQHIDAVQNKIMPIAGPDKVRHMAKALEIALKLKAACTFNCGALLKEVARVDLEYPTPELKPTKQP